MLAVSRVLQARSEDGSWCSGIGDDSANDCARPPRTSKKSNSPKLKAPKAAAIASNAADENDDCSVVGDGHQMEATARNRHHPDQVDVDLHSTKSDQKDAAIGLVSKPIKRKRKNATADTKPSESLSTCKPVQGSSRPEHAEAGSAQDKSLMYECEKGCGFESNNVSIVEAHEARCSCEADSARHERRQQLDRLSARMEQAASEKDYIQAAKFQREIEALQNAEKPTTSCKLKDSHTEASKQVDSGESGGMGVNDAVAVQWKGKLYDAVVLAVDNIRRTKPIQVQFDGEWSVGWVSDKQLHRLHAAEQSAMPDGMLVGESISAQDPFGDNEEWHAAVLDEALVAADGERVRFWVRFEASGKSQWCWLQHVRTI